MRRPGTVVVVDDSPLQRSIITRTLSRSPSLSIIGQAGSGAEGLRRIEALDPDIVSLDIELGDLNGLQVIEQVMATRPTKIVVVSSHTDAGADVSLAALSAGAVDFVTKGRLAPGPDGFEARLERAFTAARHARVQAPDAGEHTPAERIRRAAQRRRDAAARRAAAPPLGSVSCEPSPAPAATAPSRRGGATRVNGPTGPVDAVDDAVAGLVPPELVIVLSSTGGPPALQVLLAEISQAPRVPFLIVQHMPAGFTARLAGRLDTAGGARVREATDGEPLAAGTVLLAPGGTHLVLADGRIRLTESPPVGGLRPRGDHTVDAAIASGHRRTLCVVLTGMGDDGASSCARLVRAGGQVIAQDAASTVVDGMPRQVRDAGLVTAEGPPAHLGRVLDRLLTARAHVARHHEVTS